MLIQSKSKSQLIFGKNATRCWSNSDPKVVSNLQKLIHRLFKAHLHMAVLIIGCNKGSCCKSQLCIKFIYLHTILTCLYWYLNNNFKKWSTVTKICPTNTIINRYSITESNWTIIKSKIRTTTGPLETF